MFRRRQALNVCTTVVVTAVACSQPATAPAGSVSLVTARPASPANGIRISSYMQPVTLVVTNAKTSTIGSTVTDHVEVATDEAFTNVVQTQDVIQDGTGETKVTLAPLNDSTMYFWRVRSSAGTTVGPFSAISTFAIAGDGRFPSRLVLHTPAACHGSPVFGSPSDEYAFDGELTVSGGQLRFQQPQPGTYQHTLVVAIIRVGDRISGTIGTGDHAFGTASATNGFEIGLWTRTNTYDAAVFSGGVSSPSQQLTATFDANVAIWNQFGDGGASCASGTGFSWVLTPID